MSEHLPHHEKHEQLPSPELSVERESNQPERHHQEAKAEKKINVEAIHEKIEKDAKSAHETRVDKTEIKNDAEHYLVTKGLKEEAFKRNLQRARKQMSASSRTFSKVIHQPVIDAVSKVGEKTIARPTGILTGAIVALAGSSYLLYTAKHYGFQYNYLVVFILLGGGYLAGLIIELLIFGFRRLRGAK
ncbi:MAG: hypothetical protein ACXWLH_02480 [Candidatus Saccharimonadales bacterium]